VRVLKIGQYLTKLCVEYWCLLFRPALYAVCFVRVKLISHNYQNTDVCLLFHHSLPALTVPPSSSLKQSKIQAF